MLLDKMMMQRGSSLVELLKNAFFSILNVLSRLLKIMRSPRRGDVVEDVRTMFEELQDETIYIPELNLLATQAVAY